MEEKRPLQARLQGLIAAAGRRAVVIGTVGVVVAVLALASLLSDLTATQLTESSASRTSGDSEEAKTSSSSKPDSSAPAGTAAQSPVPQSPTPGQAPGAQPSAVPTPTLPEVVGTPGGAPSTSALPLGTSGTGNWVTQTEAGLAIAITPSTPATDAGTEVRFTATVTDPAGAIKELRWDFGDGTIENADVGDCRASRSGRTDFSARSSHVFRTAGFYAVRATAATGARCGSTASDEVVTATGTVIVSAGRIGSNGPQSPTIDLPADFNSAMPDDPQVTLPLTMSDTDGYINSVVINWNDESQPEQITYNDECLDSPASYPSTVRTSQPMHRYAVAGTHNISVTVTSVGCDGGSVQQAVRLIEVLTGGTAVTEPISPAPAGAVFAD